MMSDRNRGEPLLGGRLLRGVIGVALLASIPVLPTFDLAWLGITALAAGGVVFLLAAIIANPGCEISAPVNVFLPRARRISCFCPLLTPFDHLERAARRFLSQVADRQDSSS